MPADAQRPALEVLEGGCPDCHHEGDFWTLATEISSCACECHRYPLNRASMAYSTAIINDDRHLRPVA